MRLLALLAAAASLAGSQNAMSQVRPAWRHRFSGYAKTLLTTSESYFTGQPYGDVMNRLRVSYDGGRGEWFNVHADFDNETHFGNLTTQPDFQLVRERQAGSYLDLQHIYLDRPHAYWDTSLYRGYITLRNGPATLTVGRQRIGWGTARFWSPADVFNPLNPLQIETEERQGVDAALLEWALPMGITWTTAYLPQHGFRRSSTATRLAANLRGYDVAAFLGRFERDWMGGAEFAGQWGGAGLRGELTYRWRDEGRPENNALRFTFGSDYAFPNTLHLSAEYFYNQGQPAPAGGFDAAGLARFTSEIFTLGRHFLSGGAGYDVMPLFRLEAYTVADLTGAGVFVMPLARYNVTTNTDLTVGGQLFASQEGGEFQRLSNVFFAELMLHF